MAEANWHVSGEVSAFDGDAGTVALYIEGMDEAQVVPVNPLWPAWMLQPHSCFNTMITRKAARAGALDPDDPLPAPLVPHPYGHMNEQELLDALTDER